MEDFNEAEFAQRLTEFNGDWDYQQPTNAPPAGEEDGPYNFDERDFYPPTFDPNNPLATADQDYPLPSTEPSANPSTSQPPSKKRKKGPERTHTHACPYKCLDAAGNPRYFSGKHNVDQHVREKHTQERPFKCWICKDVRGFNRPFCLYRHMWDSHKIEMRPGKGGKSVVKKDQRGRKRRAEEDEIVEEEESGFDFNAYQGRITATQPVAASVEEADQVHCYICKRGPFSSMNTAFQHMHFEHGVLPSPWCNCEDCGMHFRRPQQPAMPSFEQPMQQPTGAFGFGTQAPADGGFGGFQGGPVSDFDKEWPADLSQLPAKNLFTVSSSAHNSDKLQALTGDQQLPGYGVTLEFERTAGLNGEYDEFGSLMQNLDQVDANTGQQQEKFGGAFDGMEFGNVDTLFGEAGKELDLQKGFGAGFSFEE